MICTHAMRFAAALLCASLATPAWAQTQPPAPPPASSPREDALSGELLDALAKGVNLRTAAVALQRQVTELDGEVKRLTAELAKAKQPPAPADEKKVPTP